MQVAILSAYHIGGEQPGQVACNVFEMKRCFRYRGNNKANSEHELRVGSEYQEADIFLLKGTVTWFSVFLHLKFHGQNIPNCL